MVRQGQGEAEFPQKQLETAFLHSLRLMDQNREYLQMHLAPAADSRAAQALDDMAVESARLERTFREVMELSAPEQPLHKLPLDLCQLVSQMARMEEEIKAQCGTTLRADCGGLSNMIFLYHKFCRFIDQVILIRGKFPGIRSDDDAAGCPLKIQYIINTNGLHDHLHFVIAIFQSSDHIQAQINFGICFYPIFVHFALLRFVYNHCT